MLSRGEESCGEVGLNSDLSGFFMVGEDMSACEGRRQHSNTAHGQRVNPQEEDVTSDGSRESSASDQKTEERAQKKPRAKSGTISDKQEGRGRSFDALKIEKKERKNHREWSQTLSGR